MLGQEVAGHDIFVGLTFNGFAFCVCGCISFLGHGAGLGAIEISPLAHDLHGLLEVHGECGPVGATRVKVGNIGRKGSYSRHVVEQFYCSNNRVVQANAGPITVGVGSARESAAQRRVKRLLQIMRPGACTAQ